MKLSKDRQIQILLAIVIIIMIIVIASISKNKENDVLKFGETLIETIEEDQNTEETTPVNTNVNTIKTPATTTSTSSNTPSSGGCYPNLSGKILQTPPSVQLIWTKCDSDDFQFYKLVKSATNPNLAYPNDSVIFSTTNKSATSYLDQTVAKNMTYYYRVCVVQRLNKGSCGNIVSITY